MSDTEDEPIAIADGMPMTVAQMQKYLQESYGIPVVLRKKGTTMIKCPHCNKGHDHGTDTGHTPGLCHERERYSVTLTVGDRAFVPNCGYVIFEYEEKNGANKMSTLF